MSRELTSQELSRFGFDSMEDVKKFSAEIRSNLIWGMKLYLLLENAYKQANAEIDGFCRVETLAVALCKNI